MKKHEWLFFPFLRVAAINICLQQLPAFSLAAGYVNPILLLSEHTLLLYLPQQQ